MPNKRKDGNSDCSKIGEIFAKIRQSFEGDFDKTICIIIGIVIRLAICITIHLAIRIVIYITERIY